MEGRQQGRSGACCCSVLSCVLPLCPVATCRQLVVLLLGPSALATGAWRTAANPAGRTAPSLRAVRCFLQAHNECFQHAGAALGWRELDRVCTPAHCASALPVQALTKWGGALLELAHFRQGGEAAEMIEEVRRSVHSMDSTPSLSSRVALVGQLLPFSVLW